ncbi:restriction endonuclease subunit S [Pectobacterium sp. B2J-2]|uniref:restriction endonuclease subunit S n=1 Tax=Pectobacterium sp. B2J-2 TaxID=3385372 RepID=UPI0038FBEE24
MSDWKKGRLDKFFTLKRGYDLPKQNRNSGNIPIVSSSGVTDYHNIAQIEESGVITGRYGTIGEVFYSKVPFWPLNTTLYVNDFKSNDKKFVYYLLKTLNWSQFNDKSAVPGVNRNHVHELEISFPDICEQKSIASVLSSLDDKIDLLHRQNKTLESMAETLFRQWFIEESQADWETTTLDCHITVAKGLSYKGSGLTTSDNGIPLFNLNSVLEGGGYKSTGIKYYNGDFKERHIIKSGDIIVANTEQGHEYRLIGYPAIIPTTKSELSIYTHHLFKININDDSYLTNAFMYYLLCSKDMHEQVVAATNGSTVNQLSADGLQRPEFKLPLEYKVKEFTTQIASFWKKISINNLQIKNIESLRDTLLPKLMSGEVRVQYAEEAIASVA